MKTRLFSLLPRKPIAFQSLLATLMMAALPWASNSSAQSTVPPQPEVSIHANPWKTAEPCPTCRIIPAVLTIQRSDPTKEPLLVFLQTDGTAQSGIDYAPLPLSVEIPAQESSIQITFGAMDDLLAEGPEVVRVRIVPPPYASPLPTYRIRESAGQALIVIGDDEPDAPEARLDIVIPASGSHFPSGAPVSLAAIGVWTNGEIDRPVSFYSGNTLIGRSNPPLLARPTIPCLPSIHSFNWENPPAGDHVITARIELSSSQLLRSPPVRITIGDQPPRSVVSIEATQPIAEESSFPFRRLALTGLFTISRTGPTDHSLPIFIHYSGTATPEDLVKPLPWLVTLPSGASQITLGVEALPDEMPEGIETLVATLSNCPPDTNPPMGIPCVFFEIDPARQSATVFLRDDGQTQASLSITRPLNGAEFHAGQSIAIDAVAIDLDGYISRVEFWDGDSRIGVSEIVFIRAPDPGTPIHHSFDWQNASPGSHVLTARAGRSTAEPLISAPVAVRVGPRDNQPPELAIISPTAGEVFPPFEPLSITVRARDPDGYVRRVAFFANGLKIGEVGIEFIVAPPPGQTQEFQFEWSHPAPGPYALSARASDNQGGLGSASPVNIVVRSPDTLPVIRVVSRDPLALEPVEGVPANNASFLLKRYGPTDLGLVVRYTLHGTAENGVDYERLPGQVAFPPGSAFATVTVRPLRDEVRERMETVILRLQESAHYRLGHPARAIALISDRPWNRTPGHARCAPLGDGLIHICFAAESGRPFKVEGSRDFRLWETLHETVAIDEEVHFVDDEGAAHTHRFYRLTESVEE